MTAPQPGIVLRPRRAARAAIAVAPAIAEALESRRLLADDPYDVLVFSKTVAFRHDSIDEGIAAVQALGAANNFSVVATEDAAAFNDVNLARFEAVVFLSTTGDVLNAAQQSAFERYIAAGGGYVGVHSAADTEYGWAWYGGLVGAYFNSHPAIQQATVKVADQAHPATAGLPKRWVRTDEWYNYRANPRGNVHVLATLDEGTYSPGAGAMGFDHPIAWCQTYMGGRSFYTGLGHTAETYAEPLYRQHLLGGIRYAAGAAPADDGATVSRNFRKVVLDADTLDPMQLDVAPDGRVFYALRGGEVKLWSPATGAATTAGTIPVVTTSEDGLLGLALDPNFATNHWLYLFYSATPDSADEQRVSRFTVVGNQIDMGSERVLLRIPVQRSHSNHSGGGLGFGPDGSLYIATGDNTNPFESNGYAPIDERPRRSDWDAQKASSNTNDLRGKILRIRPQANGAYTIPAGNLFPPGTAQTRPEIYVMGNRNPFRFSVDRETGWLYWGEVGPDAQGAGTAQGPKGHDEYNQARSAGNYGWPYFVADNKAYNDYNFATGVSGPLFNPAAPVNNSPNSTGIQQLPAARPAWIWYPYDTSTEFPELGAGGRTAMAGPVYHYDPANPSSRKLPAYYDDTLFIYEWSRNWIKEVKLDAAGNVLKINPFAPNLSLAQPIDMKVGPDGAIYLLEWGYGWGGNPDSQLVRVEYVKDFRPPAAAASADRDAGPAPLAVQFSSSGTDPGDRAPLTYAWDFDGNGTTDSTAANPAFTYTQPGNYAARLVVTDTAGMTSQTTVNIAAGNSRPQVSLTMPLDGSFFTWGAQLPYWAEVTDAEDGSTVVGGIAGASIVVQPILGHDSHGHPLLQYPGPSGVFPVEAGHGNSNDNIFMLVEARYTDRGAAGVSPLTGRTIVTLQPRRKQAEHFSASAGVIVTDSGDAAGGGGPAVTGIDDGDWISFRPVNLRNINQLRHRVATGAAGGRIEVRADSPAGTLLGTATLAQTGGTFTTLPATVTDPGGTHELFFVFRGTAAQLANLKLNWTEFDRAGNTAPAPVADRYAVSSGVPVRISAARGVLANDADAQQDALFAGLTPTGRPANGAVSLNPDGSFTYTPNAGFSGTDSFTYFAHDGVFASAPVTVTVEIVALPGDINRDRFVNGSDFAILAGNFGRTSMTYEQGDLNADGAVNGTDFAILAANFGRSLPQAVKTTQVAPASANEPTAPAGTGAHAVRRTAKPVARRPRPLTSVREPRRRSVLG